MLAGDEQQEQSPARSYAVQNKKDPRLKPEVPIKETLVQRVFGWRLARSAREGTGSKFIQPGLPGRRSLYALVFVPPDYAGDAAFPLSRYGLCSVPDSAGRSASEGQFAWVHYVIPSVTLAAQMCHRSHAQPSAFRTRAGSFASANRTSVRCFASATVMRRAWLGSSPMASSKHYRLCTPWRLIRICRGFCVVAPYNGRNAKAPADADASQILDHGSKPGSDDRDHNDNRATFTRNAATASEGLLLPETVMTSIHEGPGSPLPPTSPEPVEFNVPLAIFQVRGLSMGARIMWSVIASARMPVSEIALARLMNVRHTAIRYYTGQLVEAGLLRVDRRNGRKTQYEALPLPAEPPSA